MSDTLALPRGVSFRWCRLCAKPGRLHIEDRCQMCLTFPRTCSWTADCRAIATTAAASPYRRQLDLATVPVCDEHRRVARAAGWSV